MTEKCKHHRMCLRETNDGPEWYCSQCCKSFVMRTKSCDDCPEKQLAQNAIEKCLVLQGENEKLTEENKGLRDLNVRLSGDRPLPGILTRTELEREKNRLAEENKNLRETANQFEAEVQQANQIIRENEEDAKTIEELKLKIKLFEKRLEASDKMHIVDDLQIGILIKNYQAVLEKLIDVIKSDAYQPKKDGER